MAGETDQKKKTAKTRFRELAAHHEETLHVSVGLKLILATSYSPTTRCGSTITAEGLNCCVRYGNRWYPFALATKKWSWNRIA